MRAQYKDFLEDFYPMLLNFTQHETPIEQFERLNYVGVNFIELSGSLLINLIFSSIFLGLLHLLNKKARKHYRINWLRKLASLIPLGLLDSALMVLFKEGYLELLIPIFVQ